MPYDGDGTYHALPKRRSRVALLLEEEDRMSEPSRDSEPASTRVTRGRLVTEMSRDERCKYFNSLSNGRLRELLHRDALLTPMWPREVLFQLALVLSDRACFLLLEPDLSPNNPCLDPANADCSCPHCEEVTARGAAI